jgi:TatD DNase family protein
MRLIDTHCHLNFPDAFPDPDSEIQTACDAGVEGLVLVGCDLPSSAKAIEIAERHTAVHAVVGIHPNYSASLPDGWLQQVERLLDHPKAVALGEIGLDFHWDFAKPSEQEVCLVRQLDLARSSERPVVFHCRKAYPELLTILERAPLERMLFHCFSGSAEDARRAVALGAYLGVDGPITYKGAGELREILKTVPAERILIETDSPYMTPVPHRGKPNRPAYVVYVNRALASLLGVSEEACAAMTTRNAERFFGLASEPPSV